MHLYPPPPWPAALDLDECLDSTMGRLRDLFDVVGKGAVKVPVNQKYPLRDAVKAHRDLEGRATTGSSILIP